jgi:hypothetical protein
MTPDGYFQQSKNVAQSHYYPGKNLFGFRRKEQIKVQNKKSNKHTPTTY